MVLAAVVTVSVWLVVLLTVLLEDCVLVSDSVCELKVDEEDVALVVELESVVTVELRVLEIVELEL